MSQNTPWEAEQISREEWIRGVASSNALMGHDQQEAFDTPRHSYEAHHQNVIDTLDCHNLTHAEWEIAEQAYRYECQALFGCDLSEPYTASGWEVSLVDNVFLLLDNHKAQAVEHLFPNAEKYYQQEWLARDAAAFWGHLDLGNRRRLVTLAVKYYKGA